MEKVRKAEQSASKSRALRIDFTPKKNSRGSETTFHTAFSAAGWNLKTLQFLKSVNSLSADEMQVVMDLSRDILKDNDSRLAELEDDNDDPRGNLQQRTFNDSEIESICSDDENMPGWDSMERPQNVHASGSSSSRGKSRT